MRQIFACAAILGFGVLAWAAQPVSPAKKAPGKTTAVRKITSRRAPARTSASKSGKAGVATRRPAAPTWRNRQMAPTPERYRQIQEALASKGFLSPQDATGTWNQASIEGLKRFQADQNIEATGKINSLSLIALGLGPRYDATAVKPPAPVPAQDQPSGR
jgi:peptidoglycan hydrolase-like protein with peptidoglycan-binding domain